MDFVKQAESFMQQQGGGQDIVKQAQGLMNSVGDKQQQSQSQSQSTPDQSSSGASQTASSTTGSSTSSAEKPNPKVIYGSAQTLFQGIQDKMAGTGNVSDAQLADAADNILQAVKNSGLDPNNQYGQYFEKAESYLAKYKEQGSNTTGTGDHTATDSKDASGTTTDAPQSSS